jgi:mono/diheme cytochrome c family protein
MNLLRSALYSGLLAGTTVSVALFPAASVDAGSSLSSPSLPARFLSELQPYALGVALQEPAPAKKADDDALPDGKGKDLAKKDCNTCHLANVWTKHHYTRDQWSSIIDAMVAKGLNAPDEDLDKIADYLATYFGPAKSAPQPAAPDSPAAAPPQ